MKLKNYRHRSGSGTMTVTFPLSREERARLAKVCGIRRPWKTGDFARAAMMAMLARVEAAKEVPR